MGFPDTTSKLNSDWPDSATFWRDKAAIVTGGAGFLGSFVVEALQRRGAAHIVVPRQRQYDLTQIEAVRRLLADSETMTGLPSASTVIVHLAAQVGGIGANQLRPGEFFFDNLMMGALLMDEARRVGVRKFVSAGTVCSYPKHTPVPFREQDLWSGFPEETNAPYGIAKKMLLVQGQAYRQQYGFNSIHLLPVNLYGPRDNFDPASSHVIPALIRKCIEAKELAEDAIVVWGDGSPTREFLFVEDAAEGILLAAERYDGAEPVNLGSAFEISVSDLVTLIARATGFTGAVLWDTSKPNGQPRRKLDTTRAETVFGFRSQVDFATGLQRTIAWYEEQRRAQG